ncbi:MAG: S8 family serine peptidase [Elusimicrobia bacterium]|nr:S8 family serine peptidase [Elusimicrobiota bacterium]
MRSTPPLAVAVALLLPGLAQAFPRPQQPTTRLGPEQPAPLPFKLPPGLMEQWLGNVQRRPASAEEREAVRFLQERGVPPSLFIIEPTDAGGKAARVDLYELDPAQPTPVGLKLHQTLKPLSEEALRQLPKKKLYVVLTLLQQLVAAESAPGADAFPEEARAIQRRVDMVMALHFDDDRDFAGLGTDPKPLQEAIGERRDVLRRLIESAQGLPADPAGEPARERALALLKEQFAQLGTLALDAEGKPLLPKGLYDIVRSLPESSLTERQWRTLFYSYPMGRSLWELRADRIWRGSVAGKGVRVAILDTGIDAAHPDLLGAVVNEANFTDHRYTEPQVDGAPCAPRGRSASAPAGGAGAAACRHPVGEPDVRGEHGTHVASTVHAIAPEATILNIKVLDEEAENIPDSRRHDPTETITSIYDGLDYVLRHNRDVEAGRLADAEPIQVVSMSLGLPKSNTTLSRTARDLLSRKVKELADAGVIVVVATGNEGNGTARRPGLEATAITVGAADFFGRKAPFSSNRSVVDEESGALFDVPTVWAPGHEILGADYDPSGAYREKRTAALHQRLSGTSMATPHVAGAVALLIDAARKEGVRLTPSQVQQLLRESSEPLRGENPYARTGGGLLDVERAIRLMRQRFGKAPQDPALEAERLLRPKQPQG